ncbi:hypothetical protein COCCADRAFT_97412 [Bipolaris zeicola 26-R-13]|uniref:Zn(2)-C6 fungal-type domain-containing protein n=1 Tax=Cochliobolus carbonum (strain 26-R-13) TaxID=930089 RepID=W6Y5J4_COCC2|nr:uncharacterized protein COCCADRAFT_97412 [Bipolaris zeicola 26-R-13]EUC32925.1 hypothetical protein COCCADRAFT_97412 [Bipolaris zeicola 26-R-13]
MQSLVLPGPTSLLSTPFGRPAEAEDGLSKLRAKFSPHRSAHQDYPSPPMSEPQSPARRPAQSVESARLSYSQPVGSSQRQDSFVQPPAPPSIYDPRSSMATHVLPPQRPLYPGESQPRDQALSYQTGRPLQHQPYGHSILQPYGYGYQNTPLPPYAGVQHQGPMVQPTAMIAPPPARPAKPARRTKAHVASACVNCKKAHLSCDVQRPCGRCVASGKQETCKDVQHKKRGRPRLRDDREFARMEEGRPTSQLLGAPPVETPVHHSTYPGSLLPRAPDSQRMFGGTAHQRDLPNASLPLPVSTTRDPVAAPLPLPYSTGASPVYHSLPVAYLSLDLMIQKTNHAFAELVSFLGDVQGKHLGDLLEPRQNESLQRLRNELRDERDEREPAYMAPITPVGQDPMRSVMDAVSDQEIDHFTQGSTNRSIYLSFRAPGAEPYQSLQVQIRLAKISLYFVTLVVISPPRLAAPNLLTQQLAPPTPNNAPQTTSALNNAPISYLTPHQSRRPSSTSSGPSSPYYNLSAVRTSLPMISPGSYSSSPSYGYSPTAGAGADTGYLPTYQPPTQPSTNTYPSPYGSTTRPPTSSSQQPFRELNRPARLEGLHLPPIRTAPSPLGSPLHIEAMSTGAAAAAEHERARPLESLASGAEQRRLESPETVKRRRFDIQQMLE